MLSRRALLSTLLTAGVLPSAWGATAGCIRKRPGKTPDDSGSLAITGDAAIPFGAHSRPYVEGAILPSVETQEGLDREVVRFYRIWKERYLAEACDGVIVRSGTKPGNLTVSEAHGYGMLVLALMAGVEPDARRLFDGMVRYFEAHPSALGAGLMAWYQDSQCRDAEGRDSATDGDVDVAYALLLADKQWGSCGGLDYVGLAKSVIRAIGQRTVSRDGRWTLLGDWVSPSDAKFYRSTRSSDFITAQFRAFAAASGDEGWLRLVDSLYRISESVQQRHAPESGLLPDFIVDPGTSPRPPKGKLLEGPTDDDYSYNACRVPWRIGTDYLVSGDPRAKRIVERMTSPLVAKTGGSPRNVRAGYSLDGAGLGDYLSMAFVAPFGVAAMVDARHQRWLNAVWNITVSKPPEGYYEDSIKLLCLIVMSGNWWSPEGLKSPCRGA